MTCFATSDRVCEDDLPLALSFPGSWSQHIVLREWVPLPPSAEFRAFVYGGRLTGLSQYFCGACFPVIVDRHAELLTRVQHLFASIRERVPVTPADYVLDLAILPDDDRAFVIELNPFGPPDGMGTGTCLFRPSASTHDADVLFGRAPFEFRFETQPTAVAAVAQLVRDGTPLRDFLRREFPALLDAQSL